MEEKMSPEMIGILILEEIKGMRADMKQELAAIRMEFASYVKSNEESSRSHVMELPHSNRGFDTQEGNSTVEIEADKVMVDHEYTSSSTPHNFTIHVHDSAHVPSFNEEEIQPDEVDLTDNVINEFDGQSCEEFVSIIPKSQDSYTCEVCGIVLRNKGNLNRHMKIHTNEKPFSCPECYKAFRDRYELATHSKIHSKDPQAPSRKRPRPKNNQEKSYMCSVCGAVFAQPGNLKRHIATHTNERPFSCEVCGCYFRRKEDKIRHLASKKHSKKMAESQASEIAATEEIIVEHEK